MSLLKHTSDGQKHNPGEESIILEVDMIYNKKPKVPEEKDSEDERRSLQQIPPIFFTIDTLAALFGCIDEEEICEDDGEPLEEDGIRAGIV